jgi:hypothetical protein
VTDFGGGTHYLKTGNIVAGNPAIYKETLEEVKRVFERVINKGIAYRSEKKKETQQLESPFVLKSSFYLTNCGCACARIPCNLW